MMNRRKTRKETVHHVPHELTIEILLRLPVKSLLRFKCVRKSWFSLISDSHFANLHFQLTDATHTRRILLVSNSLSNTISIDIEEYDTVIVKPNPSFIHPQSHYCRQVISSCRGFVYLHRNSSFYLWNPSTGVHKQIPLSPIESNLNDKYFCYLYGFGYDELRDDYLVVSISFDITINDPIYSRLEFFSLRDNTWKELEGTHFPYINNNTSFNVPRVGTLFDGALHWLALREDSMENVILAFDLIEKKLLEMPFPDGFDHDPEYCDLWVFGEFLSLWAMNYDNYEVEIWVMKEYNVHSSWTKALVLPIDGFYIQSASPICSTKSGDIIGTDGETGLLKYNEAGQFLQHNLFCNSPLEFRSQMTVYTESILSLPDDDNVQA